MRRVVLLLAVCAAAFARSAGSVQARPAPSFAAADLATFDGAAWSGLVLGRTSEREVRKQFHTERSPYDNARLLIQAEGAAFETHALFAGRSEKSPLIAVLLRKAFGFTVEELRRAAGEQEEARYPSRRYEDWCILVFPKKGIVAPLCGGQAECALLVGPKAAAEGVALGIARSPVLPYVDPAAGKPRMLEFGRTSVGFRLEGIAMEEARVRAGLEQAMRAATAGGAMRFREGASGSYTIDVHVVYDVRRGGTANITCRVEGEGPYGTVNVSSGALALIPAQNSDLARANFGVTGAMQLNAKLREARLAVEKKVAESVRAQEPPSISSFREADWAQALRTLLDAARRAARSE